jgi:hypothetical protein
MFKFASKSSARRMNQSILVDLHMPSRGLEVGECQPISQEMNSTDLLPPPSYTINPTKPWEDFSWLGFPPQHVRSHM